MALFDMFLSFRETKIFFFYANLFFLKRDIRKQSQPPILLKCYSEILAKSLRLTK